MNLAFWISRLKRARLANETQAAPPVFGFANEYRGEAEQWIEIGPRGEFTHAQGLQRVNDAAIQAMANKFNSTLAKVGRALFGGVPFYIGHPDVPELANQYPDKKAYGWIKALEARNGGLWAQVEWSPAGRELIANKHYKYFSPYWEAMRVGMANGKPIFEPTALLSVGLTNQPNLPVKPLANEKEQEMEPTIKMAALAALLGLANTATEADVTSAITGLKTEAGKVTGLANEKATAATALENEKGEHGKTKTALANAIKQRNTLALDAAVKAGKITPAQREEWDGKLTANWEENSKALANAQQAIKTTSRLGNQGSRRATLSGDEEEALRARSAKVKALVNAKMQAGMDYDSAYNAVRLENAQLFQEMIEPDEGGEA